MIGIHPIHRRIAEIALTAKQKGGYDRLPLRDQMDLNHCLQANLDLIMQIDSLKSLSFLAYENNDSDWQHDLSRQLDELEAKML